MKIKKCWKCCILWIFFYNKEFDKINNLYSILRDLSRQKYEIVHISTEQYDVITGKKYCFYYK